MVLYNGGVEVVSLKFSALGTDNLNWFSQNMLLESPWGDLKSSGNLNMFSIPGGHRNFEISLPYGACETDAGWLLITIDHGCAWERRLPYPSVIYSKLGTSVNWNHYGMQTYRFILQLIKQFIGLTKKKKQNQISTQIIDVGHTIVTPDAFV